MHEIDRILQEILDRTDLANIEQVKIVKDGLVKAAYAAILDGGVALSICSYVEASQKKQEKHAT